MARMKDVYISEIAPALMKKFGYKSVMQIPPYSPVNNINKKSALLFKYEGD